MPDQLEDLFAELRTETISRVRPPGAAAAHRTVRRRRIATTTALLTTAAVVTGGLFATGLPVRHASPQPAGSAEVNTMLAVEDALARNAQPGEPGITRLLSTPDTGEIVLTDVAAGAYNLYLACSDTRSLTVHVQVDEGQPGGVIVGCSSDPRLTTFEVVLSSADDVKLSVTGDGGPLLGLKLVASHGAAGTPVPSEESTFNAARSADVLTGHGVTQVLPSTTEADEVHELGTLDAGPWLLSYVCAGPGKVSFTVTATSATGGVTTTSADELVCSQDGALRLGVENLLDWRSEVTLNTSPDAAALNHAGYAWSLTRG